MRRHSAFQISFGQSVALSGETAVIGAPQDDEKGGNAGAAFVYVRSGTAWSREAKLTAADARNGNWFGNRVALSGDTALISAPLDDHAGQRSGSAYVLVRGASGWSQQIRLIASDAMEAHAYGHSIALSGDTALLGAKQDADKEGSAGAVYVYVRSGTVWSLQTKLYALDAERGDLFGHSVALSGNTALVGALFGDGAELNCGVVYVFVRRDGVWSQANEFTAGDPVRSQGYGVNLALSGSTAVIGTSSTDVAYVRESDPAVLLQELIELVQSVNTNNNIANTGLEAKLDAAVQALNDLNENNDAAALNAMLAFIQAVQAQSGKTISTDEADALIAAAQQIIALIDG